MVLKSKINKKIKYLDHLHHVPKLQILANVFILVVLFSIPIWHVARDKNNFALTTRHKL